MNEALEMRSLLERAGFRIRGKRADCVHCEGSSRGTVSFTDELAFCHRCQWTANTFILARQLGLLRGNPEMREKFAREITERKRVHAEEEEFDRWRDGIIRIVNAKHRSLWRNAGLAQDVLAKFPDCEPAWSALGRWYHAEARLTSILDFLLFNRVTDYLEVPSTRQSVMEFWRQRRAAA